MNQLLEGPVLSAWVFAVHIYPITASVCFAFLLNRFLKPRFGRTWLSARVIPLTVHFLMAAAMGWEPGAYGKAPGTLILWYMIFLLAVSSLFFRGPLTARVYLSVTFCTFYLLSIQLLDHGCNGLFQLVRGIRLPFAVTGMPVPVYSACSLFKISPYPEDAAHETAYNIIFFLVLGSICLLQALASRYLARKAGARTWNMKWRELVFLLIPAVTGISFYSFMTFIRPLLFESAALRLAARYGPAVYLLIPLLTLAVLLAILYSCGIYEQILALGEEKGRSVMLESQVKQMEGHIRDIEQLYTGIRSMKHDMKNYLFDIRCLLDAKGIAVEKDMDGLGAYFSGIGETLDGLDYAWHTGNPVTDVVINGKYRQAQQQQTEFECGFCYPARYGIGAFDISIILNNGLNNALEACSRLKGKNPGAVRQIQVRSFCRNNMFFVEIENTFDGVLIHGKGEHFPATRKEEAWEHGLGFQNIRQCAEKYFGAAEYRYSEDKFCLTVMLQRIQKG